MYLLDIVAALPMHFGIFAGIMAIGGGAWLIIESYRD